MFKSTNRVLVKLRPSESLRVAQARTNLRPLYDDELTPAQGFAATSVARWFVADLPDGAATPWDLAHARLTQQLGISESDLLFAEPDLVHDIYIDGSTDQRVRALAVGDKCEANPQDDSSGKKVGPRGVFAWHLDRAYSQLGDARGAVEFSEPRTRIAHIDTGYYSAHVTAPEHVARGLEKNFVEGDANPNSAEDPDNWRLLLDNSGHGTGTLSVLAGARVPAHHMYLGGAPAAEVLPLRIADSVVLLHTSALARALRYAVRQHCDVATLSMGGLPSCAWAEAIDEAYLAGLCVVAAAGNNIKGLPTRHVVYPARYHRVIAVCGVMADDGPYVGLKGLETFEGNYGPDSCMTAAIAAYTPNIPWARFGCREIVRENGEGTSAATPQVAAAVALWFEKYKHELPRDWRRVEAVRNALFSTTKARKLTKQLGHGILQAFDALGVRPVLKLAQTRSDDDSFAFLRVLTGLGLGAPSVRERMLNLEIAQRWLVNPDLQKIVTDPDVSRSLDKPKLKKFMEAVIEDAGASLSLRRHFATRYPVVCGGSAPSTPKSSPIVSTHVPACDAPPALRKPPYRRLRVYALDPSLSKRLDTVEGNEVTLKIRWEELDSGPAGEYLAVRDVDAADRRYAPVNLEDPLLLAQDGWAPSEGNPQFHQQMVYAVAMKTIAHFEHALGRPVLWRPRPNPKNTNDDSRFVKQLAVRPHAIRQANAYYSPEDVALLFGYFDAAADDPAGNVPGSRVYTCLSHDIIAHETTHAILDGMYRRFSEPTNPDVLALHEAFADIVALMQHFTIPEVLEHEVSRTRGDLEAESLLGSLAVQFGYATGNRGALRDAIGTVDKGVWTRSRPDPSDLQKRLTPHSRGAILVSAVFDAFLAIVKERTADLLRIYTGGTGVLPSGAIHPDLVRRLAGEAAKSAGHVLTMCIRALDYLPAVDVTFFEYLRALITADFDLLDDDRRNYRVAFVEAFRRRGIYPVNLDTPSPDTPRTLSADTLRWQGRVESTLPNKGRRRVNAQFDAILAELKTYANACSYIAGREKLFDVTRAQRRKLHACLRKAFKAVPAFARELGVDPARSFEVHELRRATRVGPDGRHLPQVIVALTQSTVVRANKSAGTPSYTFRGGSTLVVDLSVPEIKYCIFKNIGSRERRARTANFLRDAASDPLRALMFASDRREPFAVLHALTPIGQ